MTTPASTATVDEHRLYPIHEEDNVPEIGSHELTVRYARDVLAALFPDSLVTGDICIYWERGNMQRYVAPDVFVVPDRAPEPLPRTYLLWLDPPVPFVMEVGSDSTRRIDLDEKPSIYSQQVRAEEYLYVDPPEPESPLREIRLWRLGPGGYEPVAPEPNGRYRSAVLGVEFGRDEAGKLRIYVDGEPQPGHVEESQRRRAAESRVGEEMLRRREAEERAEAEARRHAEEASLRREAEERAETEARRHAEEVTLRREAEERAATVEAQREALERQIAELQARLQEPRPE
jgi:Uma2 family endonuclease